MSQEYESDNDNNDDDGLVLLTAGYVGAIINVVQYGYPNLNGVVQ